MEGYGKESTVKVEEAGMFVVAIAAFHQGDLNRITRMLDRTGFLCGVKNFFKNGTNGPDFTNQKFVYWLDPYDFLVDADVSTFKSVCVTKCPTEMGSSVCEYDRDYFTNYNVPIASADSTSVGSGPCYMVLMETFPLHGKCIPKPSNTVNMDTSGKQQSMSLSDKLYRRVAQLITKNRFRDYIIDIMNGWAVLSCCGVIGGLLLTLAWIGAVRSYAKVVIWYSLVLVDIVALVYTIFCYLKAGVFSAKGAAIGQELASNLKDAPSLDIGTVTGRISFKWYGNVMAAVSFGLLMFTIIRLNRLRKLMEIAVLCLDVCGETVDAVQPIQATQSNAQMSSRANLSNDKRKSTQPQFAMTRNPQIIYQSAKGNQAPTFMTHNAQPLKASPRDHLWEHMTAPFLRPLLLITIPILCFTMACWLSVLMFIISTCSIQQQSNGDFGFVWTWRSYVMVIYHSFGLIWAWQMINGFNVMVVTGSVSYYYWHRDTIFAPVRRVLATILRYNCGSAIFGGLFFSPALLGFKSFLECLNRGVKCFQKCGQRVHDPITHIVDRFLSCIDSIITYFNKDALIIVAIKGKDYCASASLARERLNRNATFLDTFEVSPGGSLEVGKTLVCGTCAICSLAMSQLPVYSDMTSSVYIASPIFLTLMTTVLSYAMAHTLLQVYATTWDSLLLNLCEDCEAYCGRPRCCPPLLMETIQKAMELRAKEQQKVSVQEGSKVGDAYNDEISPGLDRG